jgi:hypothetical protein
MHKQGPVDLWTPAHVFFGMMTRYIGMSPPLAAATWLLFECLENSIAQLDDVKEEIPSSGPESYTNMAGDLAANTLGYVAMNWWMKRHNLGPMGT